MDNNAIETIGQTKSYILKLNKQYIQAGLEVEDLLCFHFHSKLQLKQRYLLIFSTLLILLLSVSFECNILNTFLNYILGVRCFIRNNYFIWEASRPISTCKFCENISEPIILKNITLAQFSPYAYSSSPIIVKQAFLHWPAVEKFDLLFFKNLYNQIEDSYRTVDEECQFLHFKSDFISIIDVFSMNLARVNNVDKKNSWYVGWGNCHPQILSEMRKFYSKPHFLPEDSEIPPKEYVFMGYDDGATVHLDFINRLMWQAQLKGSKTWNLLPPPECEHKCKSISFLVEPGDAVLVDTRIWYHGTSISPGQFSLSIQSEYG